MHLWLTKYTDVPMREQLVTQITIGIASGELQAGDKLPSRQKIVQKFKIHANTVSIAYQELAEEGLVEFEKGRGFFVRNVEGARVKENLPLQLRSYVEEAGTRGIGKGELREELAAKEISDAQNTLFFIEQDRGLREIVVDEIRSLTGARVFGISVDEFSTDILNISQNFLILPDTKAKLEERECKTDEFFHLRIASVADSLSSEVRPPDDTLIAVISGWEKFLQIAKIYLLAARIDADSIILRSTRNPEWRRGIAAAEIIIADQRTARKLPEDQPIRTFQIVSDESIDLIATTFSKDKTSD